MCSSHTKWLWLGAVVLVTACGEAPEYRFGKNITGIQFELFNVTEGIHPSTVTLDNPRNPFREFNIGEETKFDILANGGNAGAFYAWATLLANIPIGENQFYAALTLRDIFEANEVPQEDRQIVRQMAIDGFQAVLDCFPDDVFFDVTGTFSRRLATPAFENIIELGGVPQGDWVLVTDSNGTSIAVRSTGFSPIQREVACF